MIWTCLKFHASQARNLWFDQQCDQAKKRSIFQKIKRQHLVDFVNAYLSCSSFICVFFCVQSIHCRKRRLTEKFDEDIHESCLAAVLLLAVLLPNDTFYTGKNEQRRKTANHSILCLFCMYCLCDYVCIFIHQYHCCDVQCFFSFANIVLCNFSHLFTSERLSNMFIIFIPLLNSFNGATFN